MLVFRILPAAFLLTAVSAAGQDLDRLRERAEAMWEARVEGRRLEAVAFVSPENREAFLAFRPPPILAARVSGIEFEDSPSEALVIVDTRIAPPELRNTEMDWRVRDTWFWDGNDWFLRSDSSRNPFESPPRAETTALPEAGPPPEVEFRFSSPAVDLGRFVQGDIIEASIAFEARSEDVAGIAASPTPRLSFGEPRWMEPGRGFLDLTWDTSLVWDDVSESIDIEIRGPGDARTVTALELRAEIEGQLRIEQVPGTFDIRDAPGRVELVLTNLAEHPMRVRSAQPSDERFTLDPAFGADLPAGQTTRLAFDYEEPVTNGVSVRVRLEPPLQQQPVLLIPLEFERAGRRSGGFSREDLERIIRSRP